VIFTEILSPDDSALAQNAEYEPFDRADPFTVKGSKSEISKTCECGGPGGDASRRALVRRGNEATAERRRATEDLAQSLYEASDPGGVPWARRPRVVRDAWLVRAERQLPKTAD